MPEGRCVIYGTVQLVMEWIYWRPGVLGESEMKNHISSKEFVKNGLPGGDF